MVPAPATRKMYWSLEKTGTKARNPYLCLLVGNTTYIFGKKQVCSGRESEITMILSTDLMFNSLRPSDEYMRR